MKMTYKDFFKGLETEFGISGKITLTKTMLEKHIIDANRTIVKLAMHCGINYSEMQKGEKVTISGRFSLASGSTDPFDSVDIVRSKNDVGKWEISPLQGTFDTSEEALKAWKDLLKYDPNLDLLFGCKVSFYRTKNRGDKRFSISGIKAHASIGDTVAITHDGKGALVINATKAVGDAQ